MSNQKSFFSRWLEFHNLPLGKAAQYLNIFPQEALKYEAGELELPIGLTRQCTLYTIASHVAARGTAQNKTSYRALEYQTIRNMILSNILTRPLSTNNGRRDLSFNFAEDLPLI